MTAQTIRQPESTAPDRQQADRNVCPTRRPWSPSRDEHSIHWWVKFQGRSQAEVANDYGIHQGTVSRIIDRYERWQIRVAQQAEGRLTPEERLRAQRWLTLERNEKILGSCLRIAEKTEGFIDSSKSTTQRPQSYPTAEREVRSEHFEIDRTGMVSRFLRLAFKINMEQFKLVKQNVEPPLPPLSDEELEAEMLAAAAAEEEIEQARLKRQNLHEERERRQQEHNDQIEAEMQARADEIYRRLKAQQVAERRILAEEAGGQRTGDRGQRTGGRGQGTGDRRQRTGDRGQETEDRGQETGGRGQGTGDRGQEPVHADQPTTDHRPTEPADHLPEGACAHNAHIAEEPELDATDELESTCDENCDASKSPNHARMNGQPQRVGQAFQPAAADKNVCPTPPPGKPALSELRMTPAEPPNLAALPR